MTATEQTNILVIDFKPLPKASKRVKAVKQLEESAKRAGLSLVRKPVHLEERWVQWHKSLVAC